MSHHVPPGGWCKCHHVLRNAIAAELPGGRGGHRQNGGDDDDVLGEVHHLGTSDKQLQPATSSSLIAIRSHEIMGCQGGNHAKRNQHTYMKSIEK